MSLEEVFQQLRRTVNHKKSPRVIVEEVLADSKAKIEENKSFTLGECLPEGTKEKLLAICKGRQPKPT
jgi:hypothetical protein